MPKYEIECEERFQVERVRTVTLVVQADTEHEAREIAEDEARLGNPTWTTEEYYTDGDTDAEVTAHITETLPDDSPVQAFNEED